MGGEFREVALAGLNSVANSVFDALDDVKVWTFKGEMGAGKTTLIKRICSLCGVQDNMSSPTFSIVNEYQSEHFGKIYHFDFYRLKNEGEALDIGVEEYFYSGYPCFIEWAEKIPSLLPSACGEVTIEAISETERNIAILIHE
jgi:tRNA threonylcarbamoyladenosine biosynthesis protein TsaE